MNSVKGNIDYWVACSGGVDSVVLVHLFKELGKKIGILHCNFKLRDEDSDNDEVYVRELAIKIEVPIKVKVFDVKGYMKENGGNTQLAARKLRYDWFEKIKSEYNSTIVLGHHKDDQIETFFLQLRRGGKLKGLSSMKSSMNGYLRPLLKYSKAEIYDLAKRKKWLWREDASNQKSDYLRNYYRNVIIPTMEDSESLKKQIAELVDDFQTILKFSENYLDVKFDFNQSISVPFDIWDSWPYWIKQLFISKVELTPFSVHEVNRLKTAEKGKFLKNKMKSIWNEGGYFFIKWSHDFYFFKEYEIDVVPVDEIVLTQGDVFIDKEKAKGSISFKKWQEGDFFQPLGMKGRKKVSKFLRDRKVPSNKKDHYPLIINQFNDIVGLAGMCPDENFKVDHSTRWAYRIQSKLTSKK